MTDQEIAQILKKNRIVFDPNMKATQFAGIAPFLDFLKRVTSEAGLKTNSAPTEPDLSYKF